MRKRSLDVPLPLSEEDKKLLDDMLDYLKLSQDEKYAKKHGIRAGVGLAAIQVGVLKRMFVVYIKNDEEEIAYQLVNPKIVESSVRMCALSGGEGCLSVDGEHQGLSHRAYKIRMQDTKVKADGQLNVYNGGSANSTTVSAGGAFTVSNGGIATITTVKQDGNMTVVLGGNVTSTTVSTGGTASVAGKATSTTLSGGTLYVSNGGTAMIATIKNGGTMHVSNGGYATSTMISSGCSLLEIMMLPLSLTVVPNV